MARFTDEQLDAMREQFRTQQGLPADAKVDVLVGAADVYFVHVPTPPEPRVLTFDRLGSGELVSLLTHEGRSVAAIVHPERQDANYRWARRWSLCGDVDPISRPTGYCTSVSEALAEASQALGRLLGVEIAGYEVPR